MGRWLIYSPHALGATISFHGVLVSFDSEGVSEPVARELAEHAAKVPGYQVREVQEGPLELSSGGAKAEGGVVVKAERKPAPRTPAPRTPRLRNPQAATVAPSTPKSLSATEQPTADGPDDAEDNTDADHGEDSEQPDPETPAS